jgi:hypothetical protein
MRKINRRYKRIGLVVGFAIALLTTGTLLPPSTLAGQQADRNLPRVDGETQLFPGYPLQFDGVGLIDRIGEKEIVVGDHLRALPSSADLHTPHSSHASTGRFAVGDYVGYQLDKNGAIESLWLLQKAKR